MVPYGRAAFIWGNYFPNCCNDWRQHHGPRGRSTTGARIPSTYSILMKIWDSIICFGGSRTTWTCRCPVANRTSLEICNKSASGRIFQVVRNTLGGYRYLRHCTIRITCTVRIRSPSLWGRRFSATILRSGLAWHVRVTHQGSRETGSNHAPILENVSRVARLCPLLLARPSIYSPLECAIGTVP